MRRGARYNNVHGLNWRFLIGPFILANKGPLRSYVASATFKPERTHHMELMSAAQSVGMVFGPLIQAGLTAVGCVDHSMDDTHFTLDTYTLAW